MMDEPGCCSRFDPERWDGKTHAWDHVPFIMATMPLLFHIPFPPLIGRKLTKMTRLATDAGMMQPNKEDTLVLFSDTSPFKSEIYLSVSGHVPGARNIEITGTMVSKVFDGPYNDIPTYIKVMDKYLSEGGLSSKRYYVHYAYCPGCAKKYGHNHMILFAAV